MRRYLILELELSKDVPDLADRIAGRAWTISGVESATVLRDDGADSRTPGMAAHDGRGIRQVGAGELLGDAFAVFG